MRTASSSVRLAPLAAATATLATGVLVAGVLVAVATPAQARTHASSVGIAPGVTLTHSSFTFEGHKESVWTVAVVLDGHNHLVSTSPKRKIGAMRANLMALVAQEHGIAGINGDTLYFVDPTNQPRGGVLYNGRTLKTPSKTSDAVLYTTPDNRAHIGDPGFVAHFSTGYRRLKSIQSINSLENAKNGGITLTDSNELSRRSLKGIGNAEAQKHTPSCTQVGLTPTRVAGQFLITSYRTRLSSYTRLAPGKYSFLTCGADSKKYLADTIRVGHTLMTDIGYRVPKMVSMVQGVRKLISRGRTWNDSKHVGLNDLGPYMLPESFTCVSQDGRHLLFGAVDGRTKGAAGMTYPMLTRYLLSRHCYDAMANSGSTDTQLVVRRPGQKLSFVNHLTDKVGNKPNGLVDGLVVVRS